MVFFPSTVTISDRSSFTPEPGDLITFCNDEYEFKHIGIVCGVDSSNVYYIDGNGGGASAGTTMTRPVRTYVPIARDSNSISTYLRPNYEEKVQPQVTSTGVQTKLAAVLSQYPDGSTWTSSFDNSYQCYGFAGLVIYNVFGKSTVSGKTYRWWTYAGESTSGMVLVDQVTTTTEANVQAMLANARPGDVLQFDKGASGHQHSMIIYDIVRSGAAVTGAKIYECNWYGTSGSCQVTLKTLTNKQIADRQTRSDGTTRGKLSLLTSDNWETVNGGPYSVIEDTNPPTISGAVYPSGTLTPGENFGLRGIISSGSELTNVSAHVYSWDGQHDLNYSTNPASYSYNIQTDGMNDALLFRPLPSGSYQYVVTAANAHGTVTLIDSAFVIGSPTTYTVSYNANGGTGTPASQTKTHNVPLTLTSTKPSRNDASVGSYTVTLNANGGSVSSTSLTAARTTSYTFKGWNTAANGSGTSYASGASYTANAAATLHAQWDSSTTTAAVTLPVPTRTGYSFKGWATSTSASSGITGSYTPSGNVTLYAIWEANTLFIRYHANGGVVGENEYEFHLNGDGLIYRGDSEFPSYFYFGATYEAGLMNATTFALTREGYVFQGWSYSTDGSSTVFDQDDSLRPEELCPDLANGSTTITLYAIWQANTYTITYNANGGTGAPANQTKTYGVDLTLSTSQPTRADEAAGSYTVTLNANGGSVSPSSLTAARTTSYTFKDWNTKADGSGTAYAPGASYTANEAATFYAQWNSSTGTAAVTLPTPTRTGYSFKGWATSANAPSGATGSYTPTGDVTLFATWEAEADRPTFRVGEVKTTAGKQVEVPVKLENNPGIFALTVSFSYDTSALKLVAVTPNAEIFPGTWQTASLKGATWASNAGDITANDTILTLTFEVLEGTEVGDYSVEVVLGEIINEAMDDIDFAAAPGKVTVTTHIPGDVNGDGKVSTKDFVTLMKYLAEEDVYVVEDALDVNGDGKVSTKDFVTLMKYLSGEEIAIY